MAEALVTVEQQHAGFGEVYDETRPLKRRLLSAERHVQIQGQTIEDMLAGAVALSEDVDGHDLKITGLVERVATLEYALWTQALKVQELEQMLRMERGLKVDAVEQVNAIMAQS